jgi:hypothetical protein
MNRAILLLIGMLLACPAGAVTTGYDLLESCSETKTDTPFESGVCNGYVRAVADVMFNYPFSGLQACFPVDVTRDQLVGVSIKFLREHPGVLHLSAYHNVASALLLAFPCNR